MFAGTSDASEVMTFREPRIARTRQKNEYFSLILRNLSICYN